MIYLLQGLKRRYDGFVKRVVMRGFFAGRWMLVLVGVVVVVVVCPGGSQL